MATSDPMRYNNPAIKEEYIDNEPFTDDAEHFNEMSKALNHRLIVQSNDGKIQNLLCPIELVFESANYSAPIIPPKYSPEIFCLFQNVSSNSYKASTPRTSSRKRKSDRHHTRNPKKRKKLHRHKYSEDDDLHHNHLNSTNPNEDIFSFQPHLNVNSRPKRQRKKVSYKEPDSNTIPIYYVAPKPEPKSQPKKSIKAPSKPPTQSQIMPNIESVVDNRWVQCDQCLKWRRIPTYVSDKELEGEWLCSMNKWDLNRNSCNAEEEPYDLAEEQTMKVSNGSNSTQKEKRIEFYSKLQIFYETKEIASKKLDIRQLEMAKIGKKTVDFLQLYLEVTKRGGYHYCATTKLWDQVFVSLSCFQSELSQSQHTNLSLQNLYLVYLMDYERKYFVGSKEGSNQPFTPQQAIDHETQHDEPANLHSNF